MDICHQLLAVVPMHVDYSLLDKINVFKSQKVRILFSI
jgi:hypothetical protein